MRTRVLLIEGLADARATLAELLDALGYQVIAVSGIAEARQVIMPPDVIISDLSQGDAAPFELIRELRGRPGWERVRVAALTAYDDPENRKQAAAAGFQEFLTKPISIWVLHRTLQTLAASQSK